MIAGTGMALAPAPRRTAVLVHINLYNDSLAPLIADVTQTSCYIEVFEKGFPGVRVARLAGEFAKGFGDHIIDYVLVGAGIFPPVTC